MTLIDRLGTWCAPASINFVGGETLLRTDLEKLITHAVGYGFETSFNTNGWLVTKKRALELAKAGTTTAYVSLDGHKKSTVDHSRGRAGSYEKAHEAIEAFRESSSIQVVLATILHSKNASEMIPMLHWAHKNGLQLVIQPLYQNFGENEHDPDWWKNSDFWPHEQEEQQQLDAILQELIHEKERGMPLLNDSRQLHAMRFHFQNPSLDSGLSCRAGHSDLSFDPHGNIRLCYFLEPVATIFEEASLADVWSRLGTLRRRWQVSRCTRHCNLLNCNFAHT
jgi:MoaA/NifB/PqqE/SkfB family radical SAM enzyme